MAELAHDAGLQRERTSLAWSRTSLALVANGALLLVRQPHALPHTPATVLGVLFVALAVVTVYLSAVRSRWLLDPGWSRASRRIVPLGIAVAALTLTTTVVLLVGAVR